MKRILSVIIGIMIASAALAQTPATTPKTGAVITWEKSTHEFPDMVQGDKVEHTFKFTNTGTEPLIITNVQVSCGCTTPKDWPRNPIAPGEKGELTVAFNSAGKMGKQDKVVTVVSNAVNPDGARVSFTTTVLEKKAPQ